MTVHLLSLDLLTLRLPLVSPFRTSFGVQTDRTPMLVRVEAAVGARTVIARREPDAPRTKPCTPATRSRSRRSVCARASAWSVRPARIASGM